MSLHSARPLNLPWHQSERYWLCVVPHSATPPSSLHNALICLGMQEKKADSHYYILSAPRNWGEYWHRIHEAITKAGIAEDVDVAIVPGDNEPQASQITISRVPVAQAQRVAQSLWLGEALMSGNVICYLQPVVGADEKVMGYESFARVRTSSGDIIGGAAIVEASRALGIEFAIDRQLQVQAITTFASSAFTGALFVNFFPGFIQRPEIYMEGLSETVRVHGIPPKNIVLDFTGSESQQDMSHVRRVCEYCRSKGYAIAFDDVESLAGAKALVAEIRPDYVKLDMSLVQKAHNSNARDIIKEIIDYCHGEKVKVIAEGVETQEICNLLKSMDVDLFQGYLFSPPVPVTAIKSSTGGRPTAT